MTAGINRLNGRIPRCQSVLHNKGSIGRDRPDATDRERVSFVQRPVPVVPFLDALRAPTSNAIVRSDRSAPIYIVG